MKSHPKFQHAMELLNEIGDYFGGTYIHLPNDCRKVADLVEVIAELLSEYDDIYIEYRKIKEK